MFDNNTGDDGTLRKLGAELRLPNIYADTTWCKGRVVKKYKQNSEHLADCEVWCENQRGEMTTAHGHATVVLLSRSL